MHRIGLGAATIKNSRLCKLAFKKAVDFVNLFNVCVLETIFLGFFDLKTVRNKISGQQRSKNNCQQHFMVK